MAQVGTRAVADLEDFPPQPFGRHRGYGLPDRANGRLQFALRFGHPPAPAPPPYISQRDSQSDGGVIAGQITDAFPWNEAPDYLIRDRDGSYGHAVTRRLAAMAIRDHPTAPRSPWQNGHGERLIGSIRQECLDHIIVFGDAHLRRILVAYTGYYNKFRTHLSLNKDSLAYRLIQSLGHLTEQPILGGLHHQYCRI